jgi:hypothetical protein
MILYSNLEENHFMPVLSFTSSLLIGKLTSNETLDQISAFFEVNKMSENQKTTILLLFEEAKTNNFLVEIKNI